MNTKNRKVVIFFLYLVIFSVAMFFRFSQNNFDFQKFPFMEVFAQYDYYPYYGECGDGNCNAGETQESCPNDCRTVISIQPSVNLRPGQQVTVTVYFSDSRYGAGKQVSYRLIIDGTIAWNSANGCPLGDNGRVTPDISQGGYAKITRTCNLPSLGSKTYTLEAIPTIYNV